MVLIFQLFQLKIGSEHEMTCVNQTERAYDFAIVCCMQLRVYQDHSANLARAIRSDKVG